MHPGYMPHQIRIQCKLFKFSWSIEFAMNFHQIKSCYDIFHEIHFWVDEISFSFRVSLLVLQWSVSDMTLLTRLTLRCRRIVSILIVLENWFQATSKLCSECTLVEKLYESVLYQSKFQFVSANAIGDCTGDSFIVSGTNNNVPIICGENSGQHSK